MANYKLKIVDNNRKPKNGGPQFSLSYSPDNKRSGVNTSYEILSLLKEDNDIVLEVDTGLTVQSQKQQIYSRRFYLRNQKNES